MQHLTTLLSQLLLLTAATVAVAADLQIEVTHPVECTRKTANGDNVKMHYRGTLADTGKQFDASYDRGQPLTFALGTGRVIKGFVLSPPPPPCMPALCLPCPLAFSLLPIFNWNKRP